MQTLLILLFVLSFTAQILGTREIGIEPIDDIDQDCRRNILAHLDLKARNTLAQVSSLCRLQEKKYRLKTYSRFLRRMQEILQSEDYVRADLNFLAVFDLFDLPSLFGHRSAFPGFDDVYVERAKAHLDQARQSMAEGTGEFVFRRLEVLYHYRMSEECQIYVSYLPPTLTVEAETHLEDAHPSLASLYRGQTKDMCAYQ